VFVGSPFVAVTHGSRSRSQIVARALDELLR
jgi:hypothetical protein